MGERGTGNYMIDREVERMSRAPHRSEVIGLCEHCLYMT